MGDQLRSVVVRLSANTSAYLAEMKAAGAETEATAGRMSSSIVKSGSIQEKALRGVATTAKYSLGVVALGFGVAIKEAADFGSKMALVQTLAHANRREMDLLSKAALNVGQQYGYTATQVGDAEAELIKAGISTKDILGGSLTGALTLAAAGQTDVATATEVAAAAMTQFKLKGKDVPHIADLLAAGADKALGSVTDLGYALSHAGLTAHQFKIPIEATVGTLTAFAQAGLIGERAGTTFQQVLLRLASAQGAHLKLMDHYGLSLYKANGQIKTMPQLAENLRRSFEHLAPAERNHALAVIFGQRAIQGANVLLAEGGKGIQSWITKVNDQGFAAQQASGKLNSLSGDLTRLKSAGETAFIELGSSGQGPLRQLVQDTTAEINKITKNGDLQRWTGQITTDFESVGRAALPLAKDVGGVLKSLGGDAKKVADAFNSLPSGVQKLLVTGGLLAYGANKIGVLKPVLKGLTGGGLAGTIASKATPVPVFVTNWGENGPLKVPTTPKPTDKPSPGFFPLGTKLTAGFLAYESGKEALNNLDNIHRTRSVPSQLSGSVQKIYDTLVKSNVGKYADEFHINLTKLATDLSKFGSKGDYVKSVMKTFDSAGLGSIHTPKSVLGIPLPFGGTPITPSIHNGFGTAVGGAAGVLPGINTKSESGSNAVYDLLNITKARDKDIAVTKEQATNQAALNHLLMDPAVDHYSQKLASLPARVQTLVETPGAITSMAQVRSLKRQYDLTPPEVKTLIKLLGGASALSTARQLKGQLDGLHDKTVSLHLKVFGKTDILGTVTGLLGPHTADGNTVPGQRHPYGDKVLMPLAPGEEVISNRRGQADKWRPFLKKINAGLAEGGTVGGLPRLPSFSSQYQDTHWADALKKWNDALARSTTAITNETTQRDNLISLRDQLASTVTSAFTPNLFNTSNRPANWAWLSQADKNKQILGGGDPTAALNASTAQANQFDKLLHLLNKEGLTGGAFGALASTGDLATAQAYATETPAQLRALTAAFNRNAAATAKVGRDAGQLQYGKQITAANHTLTAMERELKAMRGEIAAYRKEHKDDAATFGKAINGAASNAKRGG